MNTECTQVQIEFKGLGRRKIQGAFDGGYISSDGGVPPKAGLREVDARFGITQRLASCFTDHRSPDLIEHSVLELVRQRVYGTFPLL